MQTPSEAFFSPSKLKYVVIIVLVSALIYTVYKMMEFEDSMREMRIVRVGSGEVKKKLLPEISMQDLQKKAAQSEYRFKAGTKYFSVLESKIRNGENVKEWNAHFLKGVNIGAALPGYYPSEFSADYETYMDWFRKIAAMNANTIRIYTILPPEFYEAFAQYNLENSNSPLYLMQGVWAEETDSNNYFEKAYVEKFQNEIKDVIDVIHGRVVIKERPGHASGIYARDISSFVIGILLGREWEPVTVTTTNARNKSVKSYLGNFISLPSGSPMEAWLAQMMDFTVQYETQIYEHQRPVSFVNWLPLDPMYHNSEFIESRKIREYDNDIESIDFKKFYTTNLFKAGIYAAYHAYPYYPDFIYLDGKYQNKINAAGMKDNYLAYLEDLRTNCTDMPLIIAEYGLPSSRGNSHYTNSGLNQGGHSESDQAEKNKLITEDIFNSGCGGAIYFEWIDEWFKFNWLVMDFEVPASRRRLWHNMENPEQNFGIMAIEQRTKTIDGSQVDWNEEEKISGNNISASSDAEYFYLKINPGEFDFAKNNFYTAVDTYGKAKGKHHIESLGKDVDRGVEFLMCFMNKDSAEILVDDSYSVYSDIYNDFVPVYSSKENSTGKFVRQILLSNRERTSLTGSFEERKVHDRSSLIFGNSSDAGYSNSNWFWNESDKILEIRIPWQLLNVSDPSSRNVLDDKAGTPDIESSETEGFYLYFFVTDKNDQITKELSSAPCFYKWEKWDKPSYSSRLKKTYYELQNVFAGMKASDEEKLEIQQSFSVTKWYEDKPGAISLSFDDGTMSQYSYGVPVLDKYGLKATFALVTDWTKDNPASSAEKGNFSVEKFGWKQARELVQKGHEMASHNFYHVKMDTMSNEEAAREMEESKLIMEKNLPATINTFVFPYSSTRSDLYTIASRTGYLFARSGEESINEDAVKNIHKLSTYAIYNEDIPSVNDIYNIIMKANDKWLILNYHNIFPNDSKEMNLFRYHKITSTYSVTPEMFDRQARLVRNSGYWIAPINIVGKYIKERENARLNITEHGTKIFVVAETGLDPSVYNVPLTIKFETNYRIVQITNSVSDGIYNPRGNVIYFNVYPGKEAVLENLQPF